MGRNYLYRLIRILITAALVFSCTDHSRDVKKGELSDFAKNYLMLRMGAQDATKNSQAGAINMSFSNLFGNFNGMKSGRKEGDSTGTTEPQPGDSTLYGKPWVTCAVISETNNPDGSITTITDYGNGCDEGWDDWKYRTWGKITSTYLYTTQMNGTGITDSFSYHTQYDNYGGYYYADSSQWGMNGYSNYAGESTYDTADYTFNGWYAYSDDISYRWNDQTYSYKGSGKTTYTNKSWVTENADYEYSDGMDYYYRSTVLKPLVMDYTCTPPVMYLNGEKSGAEPSTGIYVMTYVSGIESVKYRQGGESGEFTIDYGDGTCDNLITITENGISVVIDLSKLRMEANAGTANAK